MALQPIDLSQFENLQPQFEGIFAECFKKMSVLVNKKVSLKGLELFLGNHPDFFKKFKKRYLMTKIQWDDQNGGIYFFVTLEMAIAFSAFLMGKPEKTVFDKVEAMDFDDELSEVYQEISNQICGIFNQVLAAQVDNEIHLTLLKTEDMPANGSKNVKLVDQNFTYLCAAATVDLEQIGSHPIYCLISRDFSKKFFDSDLGTDVLSASSVVADSLQSGQPDSSANFSISDVMITDYPSVDIHETIGDAHTIMEKHDLDTIPITNKGVVVKMISKNNIEIIRSIFFDAPGQEARIARLMGLSLSEVNPDQVLVSVTSDEALSDICRKLLNHKITSLPVLDKSGYLLGLIRYQEILKTFLSD